MNKKLYLMIITSLGIALFFVIGKFLSIPTPIPNFALFLQYAILVVFSFYFGPIVGLGVGFLGHFLIDLLSGYGIWMSWIVSSGVFGLLTGLASKIINKWVNPFKFSRMVFFVLATILAGAICWMVIAPLGDILIFNQSYNVVFLEGIVAFGTNLSSALLIGLPLVYSLKRAPIKHTIINKDNTRVVKKEVPVVEEGKTSE